MNKKTRKRYCGVKFCLNECGTTDKTIKMFRFKFNFDLIFEFKTKPTKLNLNHLKKLFLRIFISIFVDFSQGSGASR